jgi:glutamate-1-semialdehyde 2,1-aminomutase
MKLSNEKSRQLLKRAMNKIPGAVNSPVRAWSAVKGSTLFIDRAQGAHIFDADGNRFIDYVGSYGPAVLGHAHPRVAEAVAEQVGRGFSYGAPTELEIELAEMIGGAIPAAEKVRLVNSGTEAGMTAIRLARAATGREKIIKFDGCYHGHSDGLLVRAGSGGMTLGIPDSAGVPASLAAMTVIARYNSIESAGGCFEANPGSIAAVIVEPVAANMGVVLPMPQFLKELAALAHRNGALLICDEVITGFRLRYGSIAEEMGVTPDLIMLGKIIGGGMPIGAVGGRSDLMDLLAPAGPVYQAGTLSGNPISVRAGIETLKLLAQPETYQRLEKSGDDLAKGFLHALRESGEKGCVNRFGSLITMFLGASSISDADEARRSDTAKFATYFHRMLERGIYLPPSQFEAMFLSLAHTGSDIEATIAAAHESLRDLAAA